MTLDIHACTAADLTDVVDLLVEDARQRNGRNRALWAFNSDTRARIESILTGVFAGDSNAVAEYWLMARRDGRPVGIARAFLVPVPPIYQPGVQPGLMLDECFATDDAPMGTIDALIDATEARLREAGAASFIASCCAGSPWRPYLEDHGYAAVTLFMSKSGFADAASHPSVGLAAADDIPAIVESSAEHRNRLFEANPAFWTIHPQANERFEQWMRISLSLTDRTMLVARAGGGIGGYAIAQPVTPVQMPMSHDPEGVGAIDDFYHSDFGDRSTLTNDGAGAAQLLAAAEAAFARAAIRAALVVCPFNWPSKRTFLVDQGYATAKTWLFKT